MRLYYTLSDYPHAMVEVECDKCSRRGRRRTARLLAEHGPDIKLPDLLREIAQCPNWRNMDDGCQAQYSRSGQIEIAWSENRKMIDVVEWLKGALRFSGLVWRA